MNLECVVLQGLEGCSWKVLCIPQAIDEAKKRAVAQHCDYETFKNMVGSWICLSGIHTMVTLFIPTCY